MGSVYFTKVDLKALKSGRTEHHQLRMSQLDSTEQVGCQSGFESFEVGKNRASSVANDPTKWLEAQARQIEIA